MRGENMNQITMEKALNTVKANDGVDRMVIKETNRKTVIARSKRNGAITITIKESDKI
jgi:hypothetical protein